MPVTAPTTPAEPASSVTPGTRTPEASRDYSRDQVILPLPEAVTPLSPDATLAGASAPSAVGDDAAFVSQDVSSVVVRRPLAIYASPEFAPATDTGARLARRDKVRVTGVVTASTGEPRLAISGGYISAAAADVRRPVLVAPKAKASLTLDLDTGTVLWADNADAELRIASVTKLLSIFVVRDWMAAGGATWGTMVTMADKNLVKMSKDWSTGGFKFKRNSAYSIRQLYTLSLVESSNAAITALGVQVAGSNTAFLDRMNTKAAQIGMNSSYFISASGLDNKSLAEFGLMAPGTTRAEGNVSTAADVGRLASALLAAYPDVLDTTAITETTIRAKKVKTTNQMLPGGKHFDKTLGIDGLKTGYTSAAGYCLVAASHKTGKHRLVTVILGAKTSNARFGGTKKLLHSIHERWGLWAAPEGAAAGAPSAVLVAPGP
jgi:D-alanyl-D-alanine carboxypeptidase (penicillin-binding protein 5/6)